MKKVFVILACLPEESTPSAMGKAPVFVAEYPTRAEAKQRIAELIAPTPNYATNPYVYWIEKSWRADEGTTP